MENSKNWSESEKRRVSAGGWLGEEEKKCINYLQLFDLQLPTFMLRWAPRKFNCHLILILIKLVPEYTK